MADQVVKKTKKRDLNKTGYLFVLPFVIVFLTFSIYPVIRTFYLSFSEYANTPKPPVLVGFKNYARVFGDKFFWQALGNTVRIWGVNIILQLGLAFLLTMVFSDFKYKIYGLPVFRAIYYLPNLIAATSVAFLFKTLLDWRFGTVNQILQAAHITKTPINWLGDPKYAGMVIAVIGAWMWFGNSFIVLMAGVQGINRDYFEAAAIDGAGRWTVFAKITIPLLRPIMLYVFVTSLIGGLQLFDVPFLIIGNSVSNVRGSIQTVVMYLYKFGFEVSPNQVGYSAAIAYVLFFIILIVSAIQFKLLGTKED